MDKDNMKEYQRHRRSGTLEQYYSQRGGRKYRKHVQAKDPKEQRARATSEQALRYHSDSDFRRRKLEASKLWQDNNPASVLLKQALHRARLRNIPLTITLEDVEFMLADGTCAATGVLLEFSSPGSPFSPSLDRRDRALGYVPGNVWVVCSMYNMAKNKWTEAEVLKMARGLVEKEDEWLR